MDKWWSIKIYDFFCKGKEINFFATETHTHDILFAISVAIINPKLINLRTNQ